MIPRILVPIDARPPAADPAADGARRRPSSMDERALIPPALPIVTLDGRTNIPASLPLESIAARTLVPRDVNWELFQSEVQSSAPLIPTDMDERVAVPSGARPPAILQPIEHVPLDLVDPDILTTGEIQLLASEQKEKAAKSELLVRISSGLIHALIILALIYMPQFSRRDRSQEETEIARRQLSYVFLPPGLRNPPRVTQPAEPRSDKLHIDPRILRRIAPPEPQPLPGPPEPERVIKNLPNAPTAQPSVAPPQPAPPKSDQPRPPLKLELPDQPQPSRGLVLPKLSPGRAIEESAKEAARSSGRSAAISGPLPGSRGAPGGGGPSQGLMSNGIEMLTPTEGVDFSNYLARVLASVRRNWYSVIPESARLGDRGRVILQFKILRQGAVPAGEPALVDTSGKEPLDRAAVSAIRTSSPFEPLPPAFSGPYIELRFIFLYNLPIDYAQ
ncbi:MAG: TonB family protein [Acidobacteriia bacterium]|nr:TonB family protein [Terriglobia bacterium]